MSEPPVSFAALLHALPGGVLIKNLWDLLPHGSKQSLLLSCSDVPGLARNKLITSLTVQVVCEYLDWLQDHRTCVSRRYPLLRQLGLVLQDEEHSRFDFVLQQNMLEAIGVCAHVESVHLATIRLPDRPSEFWPVWKLSTALLVTLAHTFPHLRTLSLDDFSIAEPDSMHQLAMLSSLQKLVVESWNTLSKKCLDSIATLVNLTDVSLTAIHHPAAAELKQLSVLSCLTALTRLAVYAETDIPNSTKFLTPILEASSIQEHLQVLESDLLALGSRACADPWLRLVELSALRKLVAPSLEVERWQQLLDLSRLTELSVLAFQFSAQTALGLPSCPESVQDSLMSTHCEHSVGDAMTACEASSSTAVSKCEVPLELCHPALQVLKVTIHRDPVQLLPALPHLTFLQVGLSCAEANPENVARICAQAHAGLQFECLVYYADMPFDQPLTAVIEGLLPAAQRLQHLVIRGPRQGSPDGEVAQAMHMVAAAFPDLETIELQRMAWSSFSQLACLSGMRKLKKLTTTIAPLLQSQPLVSEDVDGVRDLAEQLAAAGVALEVRDLWPEVHDELCSRLNVQQQLHWRGLVRFHFDVYELLPGGRFA